MQFLSILLDYTPPGDLTRRQRNRHLASGGSHSRDSGAEVNRSSNIEAVDGPMANLFCSFVSRLQLSEVCVCVCVVMRGEKGYAKMCVKCNTVECEVYMHIKAILMNIIKIVFGFARV